MSRQEEARKQAIHKRYDDFEKAATKVVSDLSKVTSEAKLIIPFLHDNIHNSKGDLFESDRALTAARVAPLFPEIMGLIADLTEVFDIHDDDLQLWLDKQAAFVAKYPNCIDEVEAELPQVI